MAWVYCLQIQDSCSKGELERSAVEVLVGLIARILAVSFAQPANVAVGTITLLDDTTAVAVIDTPATSDSTNQAGIFGYLQFPGTGLYCKTKIKVTNVVTTHLTVYYG